jgi:hypothetical protein
VSVTVIRAHPGRRSAIGIGVLGAAAALSIATVSNPWLANSLSEGLSESLQGVKTVAAMLADRSPGERPEGALASLKPKRQAVLAERLPKVHAPSSTAYEALAGPPPSPPIAPPPEAPLYTAVAGAPTPLTPVAGGGGGPPNLSNIPLPGGGGGGILAPPVITTATPEVPQSPVSAVPEPMTWTMMILGFAIIARVTRRRLVPAST